MTQFLDFEDVLAIADIAFGRSVTVRDFGLLQSAVHRPSAGMFGQEAYPDLYGKAAALLQSLIINHPFVDGNKRTAWLSMYTFLGLNGIELKARDVDAAESLVIRVATGELDDVTEIAQLLRQL